MKANEKKLLEYIEGRDKNFIIPVYQRNYDWKKEQCQQLLNDLKNINESRIKNYFLGSIVSIYNMDNSRLIIDGQQRLTTISLLLLSIYHLTDDKDMAEEIRETYLINKRSKNQKKKIKLKPIKKDEKNFNQLIEMEKNSENYQDNLDSESNITNNYSFFRNELKEEKLEHVYSAIETLMIVDIELKQGDDDPQKVFESLNATGIALTEGDKICNFILMNEPHDKQEEFYNAYWTPIEANTGFNVSEFIRHFLTYENKKIPSQKRVYVEFKNYYQEKFSNSDKKEKCLKKLLLFSEYYKTIKTYNYSNNETISKLLEDIDSLEVTVSYPFLLALFHSLEEEKLTNEQVIEALKTIITYCFRRLICEVPTNGLNKIFPPLYFQIKKVETYTDEQFVEILKYKLNQKSGNAYSPKDDDFKNRFLTRDIYNMKSKNKNYLFKELENYQNRERIEMNELQIEHIMPQKLTSKWKEALGDNWEEIHDKYLNVLGNLTLTGYNQDMSNKSFKEKKDIGFAKSRLFLNKHLETINKWSKNEIIKRGEYLKKRALEIWPYSETSFIPSKKEQDMYSLEDEENFSFKKIISYSFLKEPDKPVNAWNHFLIEVLENLYDMDKSTFANFKGNPYLRKYISTTEENIRKAKKIKASPYFVETSLSCESILTLLRTAVKKTSLELTDIEFAIENED